MAISLSSTHVIDLQAMFGQGLIIPLDELSSSHRAIPTSIGCERQVTGGRYDQVFATVNHPEHGYIGVTSAERRELGLPESIPVGGLGFRRTGELTSNAKDCE